MQRTLKELPVSLAQRSSSVRIDQYTQFLAAREKVILPMFDGQLVGIQVADAAAAPMQSRDEVEVFVARQRVVDEDRLTSSGVDVPTGQWTHVAGTWDGAYLRLYVNGEEVASKPTTVATMDDSSLQVDIGAAESVVSFGGRAGFFDGALDEVYIFDRALNETEVRAIMVGG